MSANKTVQMKKNFTQNNVADQIPQKQQQWEGESCEKSVIIGVTLQMETNAAKMSEEYVSRS